MVDGWYALAGLAALTAASPARTRPALVVEVSGFEHDRGHAVAKLHRRGEDLRSPRPFARARASIEQGRAVLVFADVPDGAYAVIAFHDENDNDTLDHNWLRLPREPLGFSNRFRPGLLSGLPTFEKLQIEVDRRRTGKSTHIQIEVK